MLSFRIIIIWYKKLRVIGRGGQHTNKFSIGNINVISKRIRGIPGSCVRVGTVINGKGREVQIWDTKFNRKGMIESVIKCPVVLFYH